MPNAKTSKRTRELLALKTQKAFKLRDAIETLKKFSTANFLETAEAHINLNSSLKRANSQFRSNLLLPHGTGKNLKVAVYSDIQDTSRLLAKGASQVGFSDLIESILLGRIDFDILLTTPALAPKLTLVGKILGPKGLMPSQSAGTVTSNVEETLLDFKKGRIEFKADKQGSLHLIFGTMSFSSEQLIENLMAIYDNLIKNRPVGVKGSYISSLYICTTMSPSLRLDLSSFTDKI